MGIEEFTKELAEMVQAKLNGVEVTPMKNLKNNGVVLHGLTLRKEGENVAPTLYLEHLFELFQRNELSVEAILEKVIRTYERLPEPNIPEMNSWLSDPELINRINVRLLNMKENRELIETRKLVYREVENTGLVCLFYIRMISEGTTVGDIALTESLMERYLPNIRDAEVLFHLVMSRVKEEDLRFEPVANVVNHMIERAGFDLSPLPMEVNFLHVLTTRGLAYGSSVILSEAARRILTKKYPGEVVILLPASVHEVLIMRQHEYENIFLLRAMVRDINHTQVEREDFLSDEVFYYDTRTGILSIANVDEGEVEE